MKLVRRFLVLFVLLGAIVSYAALGYFQVDPDEQAVVLLLGRHVRSAGPGPHFHAFLLETVERERVIVEREEFGFRTLRAEPPQEYEERPEEKRMLTGDTNVLDVEFVVQWQIVDLGDYLFNARGVSEMIRDVAQSAMREIVARRPIDDVLTGARGPVEEEARERMQQVLDRYGAGVVIRRVELQEVEPPEEAKDAFRDVVSAQQDKERLILEAHGYADQVVPRARGESREIENQARAYEQKRILEAQGEAHRFNALLVEYRKAPAVTRERLYIETLEAILPGMEKVIIEEGQAVPERLSDWAKRAYEEALSPDGLE